MLLRPVREERSFQLLQRTLRFHRGLTQQSRDFLHDLQLPPTDCVRLFCCLHTVAEHCFPLLPDCMHPAQKQRAFRVSDKGALQTEISLRGGALVTELRFIPVAQPQKSGIVHDAADRAADRLRRFRDAQQTAGCGVDADNGKIPVDRKNPVRNKLQDFRFTAAFVLQGGTS